MDALQLWRDALDEIEEQPDNLLRFPQRSNVAPLAEANRAREEARQAAVRADHWTGAKYRDGRDVAEIAKLIRADIKTAVAGGSLACGAYSVRVSRYSMGQSITINAYLPFAVRDENKEEANRAAGQLQPWMTREGAAAYDALEKIGNAYNYDRSDTQSDHFDYEFCLHVNVSSEGE